MSEILRDAIRTIVKDEFEENYGVVCAVESVDANALLCDCVPINGDASFLDVRLQAGSGNGVIMIPKEGSTVIVQPINEVTGYISLFSEIESIQFLDGSYGGLIKIDDLVNKLNTIESDINDLKQVFTTWAPVAQDGGAALKTAAATWYATPIVETQTEEIENDKITHGDV